MPTACSSCGGTEIEHDHARGDAVCMSCGSVLEDNIIVSEVSFQEQTSGSSSVIGQFVSSEGGGGFGKSTLHSSGLHHGLGKDSRELTLQQAKKRLVALGNLLKLNQHCIDTAFNFFKMALQLNLTRGRKSSIIDTACLYLVCRSEGTPHLLLDFSDVLQINVYSLGRAYLKLSNALHINPPALDPCLYIHRFAHKLELGESTHEVSMTALRLVARMKRDWIHHGRRPAGLCGAALLVSARLHNFSRSVKQVARVVRVSEGTIRKRLGDFRDTASSRLTIDEFLKIDLEQEHDPPSFLEAKSRGRHQSVSQEESAMTDETRKQLDNRESNSFLVASKEGRGEERGEGEGGGEGEGEGGEEGEEVEGTLGYAGITLSSVDDLIAKAQVAEAFMSAASSADLDSLARLADQDREAEAGEEGNQEGEALSLEDIDDEEIDKMILSEEESRIKSKLWFAENGDYLKEQEERRAKLAVLKAEKGERAKKRPRRKRSVYQGPPCTAGEAIERMLVEKNISSKINYDVLRDLDDSVRGELAASGSAFDTSTNGLGSSGRRNDSAPLYSGGFVNFGCPGSMPIHPLSASLTIKRTPSTSSDRLPSLSRKRSFSALGAIAMSSSASSKYSRTGTGPEAPSPSTAHMHSAKAPAVPPASHGDGTEATQSTRTDNGTATRDTRHDTVNSLSEHGTVTSLSEHGTATSLSEHGTTTSLSEHGTTTSLSEHGTATSLSEHGTATSLSEHGTTTSLSEHGSVTSRPVKVVEETGPVEYSEEEDENDEDDENIDELAYEGDPLLNSDYEEGDGYD